MNPIPLTKAQQSALFLDRLPQAETAAVYDTHYDMRITPAEQSDQPCECSARMASPVLNPIASCAHTPQRLQRICHGHQPLHLRNKPGNVLRQQQRLLL